MISADPALVILGPAGTRPFAKVVQVDRRVLVPRVRLLDLVGAYAIDDNPFRHGSRASSTSSAG